MAIVVRDFFAAYSAEVLAFSGDPLSLFEPRAKATRLIGSPVLEQIDVPGARGHQGLREGLAVFRFEDAPLVVYCRWERTQPQEYRVSVLARDVDSASRMLDAFSAFLATRRAITASLFARVDASLNERLRRHMGDGSTPHVVTHTFPTYRIADASIQIRDFFHELGALFTGIGTAYQGGIATMRWTEDPLALLEPATVDRWGRFDGFEQTAPVFEQIDVDAASRRLALRSGIVLFHFDGEPMFASCGRSDGMHEECRLTVVARDADKAAAALDAFLDHERAHSILRGRLIRPQIAYGSEINRAEVLPSSSVDWSQVVLPDALQRVIVRDVLGYIRAAEPLAANGIDPRRSFLFHGPPGVGKTYLCRLLANELRGFTSVLIAGNNLQYPEGAFALARSLAPAVLFFEDVDLVAKDRDGTPYPTALGGLLNELDGLAAGERIYVVFTTNRLDVLEPALAQRPGRVDTIVRLPLPEAPLRDRLIRVYGQRAAIEDDDVEWIVQRTDGVTPAFLREFMKEAVYTAICAGDVEPSGIARIARRHLDDTFRHFERIRHDHGADRILGFRE